MSAAAPSPALLDDLSLVLPPWTAADVGATGAWVAGQGATTAEALQRGAGLIAQSRAPAVTGLEYLSIEACREAIALAEAARARLLAARAAAPLLPVTMTATLGHARLAREVYWVGVQPADCPPRLMTLLARASHQSLPPTLDAVLAWRSQAPVLRGPVVVMMGATVEPRVVAQWHKLAAAVQRQVRLAVLCLPWPGQAANARGADEVVTWQTGLSLAAGGVDFGDGCPRPSPALDTLLDLQAIDLLIEATPRGIHIGPPGDPVVRFVTPGLVPGLAAQVARFDGTILWLCDDPAHAPPDPAVALLASLRRALEPQP